MPFCSNHDCLYFDTLKRTKKPEVVYSLIQATYQTKMRDGDKSEIARLLKSAYELYMYDSGSYTGDNIDQFFSQYTIGHELGIWINSELDLNNLAIKVAKNEITIRDYFDIVFLNYIQPIDGKIVHPLYDCLKYLKYNNKKQLTKEDMSTIFKWVSNPSKNEINGLYNMFLGTNYFKSINNKTLQLEFPTNELMKCCNLEFLNLTFNEVKSRFSDLEQYVDYLTKDHRSVELLNYKNNHEILENNLNLNNNLVGFNKIYYGIPGCGKSYIVSAMLSYKSDFINEANMNGIYAKVHEENIFRTTFFLDYSNSDFIGQIYPVVDGDKVEYKPVPGPFTKALTKAYLNPEQMVYLVIEEINRGNAAAIFGDLFQLLDRNEYGSSEYPISNEFVENYFKLFNEGKIQIEGENGNIEFKTGNIVIPNNLTIFATMNTSDQNVFPLDTAFKRRWERERIVPNWNNVEHADMFIPFTDLTWGNFAKSVNEKMLTNCEDGTVTPDKNLGPYFISKDSLAFKEERYNNTIENKKKIQSFTNNVIDYLYNDVTKFNHEILFNSKYNYEYIYEYFCDILNGNSNGEEAKIYLNIFNNNLKDDVVDEKIGDQHEGVQ